MSVLPPHCVVLSSSNGSGKNLTESNRSWDLLWWKISSRAFTRTKLHVRSPTGRWDIAHEVPTDPKKLATMCVWERVCVLEIFCAGFESLLLDRCSRQSLIILRLFWVFAARQVFASEHSGVSLLCTWSILYTVMETLGDEIHCGRLLEEIWAICDEDRIDYLVNFYSKSNRLSISIFTVIVIDLVAHPSCGSHQELFTKSRGDEQRR